MTKSLSLFAVALNRVGKTFVAFQFKILGNFLAFVFLGISLFTLFQGFDNDFVCWSFTVSMCLANDEFPSDEFPSFEFPSDEFPSDDLSPDGSLIVDGYSTVGFDDDGDTPVVDFEFFRHEFFEGVNSDGCSFSVSIER